MNEMWSVFRKQNETDIIKILESKKKKSIALTIICDGKAEFSVSLLQSSTSHDPLEIILIFWFPAQETFLIIIIRVENSCVASYFLQTMLDFFQDTLIKRNIKITQFIWNRNYFWSI